MKIIWLGLEYHQRQDLSNDNWKYLGQGKNIDECKVKAVQDKDTAYSSVVYNDGTTAGARIEWGQTCYGGVKGGAYLIHNIKDGIITSLAPNGSSRLGGSEGENTFKSDETTSNMK